MIVPLMPQAQLKNDFLRRQPPRCAANPTSGNLLNDDDRNPAGCTYALHLRQEVVKWFHGEIAEVIQVLPKAPVRLRASLVRHPAGHDGLAVPRRARELRHREGAVNELRERAPDRRLGPPTGIRSSRVGTGALVGGNFEVIVAGALRGEPLPVVKAETVDLEVPADDPFVGRGDAKPEIWSYGHRNVQGAALHPETGVLWIHEFGPRGGDALNIPEAGRNYGWPLVSYGEHYTGQNIPDPPSRPDLAQPIYHWTPVISPSGMTFYTGELFSGWQGNILIGGLSSQALVRLTLDGQRVADEERIDMDDRIRDVHQGDDGAVYLLTDKSNGDILRLTPASGG